MDWSAIVTAVSLIVAIAAACGAALAWAAHVWPRDDGPLVDAIDRLLPQIQCAQCGYPGCRPYAMAIADGAPIDRCPPGGEPVVRALATLLGRSEQRVDPQLAKFSDRVARVDETRCIGCALCLPACPVDAIVGAPQFLHTVLIEECTGCELCMPPCPVDCIVMVAR